MGFRVYRVSGFGGLGSGVRGLGIRVWCLGFHGLGIRVWDLDSCMGTILIKFYAESMESIGRKPCSNPSDSTVCEGSCQGKCLPIAWY